MKENLRIVVSNTEDQIVKPAKWGLTRPHRYEDIPATYIEAKAQLDMQRKQLKEGPQGEGFHVVAVEVIGRGKLRILHD